MTNLTLFTGKTNDKIGARDTKELRTCGKCGCYSFKVVRYNNQLEILMECADCESPLDLSEDVGVIAYGPTPPEGR